MSEHRIGDIKYTPLLRMLAALPAERGSVTLTLAEIEGRLHSVQVASQKLITPGELRLIGTELVLH